MMISKRILAEFLLLILLHLGGEDSGWRKRGWRQRGGSVTDHKKLSMSYAISCALKTMQKLKKENSGGRNADPFQKNLLIAREN